MVAQATLTRLVMVRIHAGQPGFQAPGGPSHADDEECGIGTEAMECARERPQRPALFVEGCSPDVVPR